MKPLFDSPVGTYTRIIFPGGEFGNDRPGHEHGGTDLGCQRIPLKAPRAGTVTFVGLSSGLGGNKVEIDHGILGDGHRHLTKHYHFGRKNQPWQDCISVRVGDRVVRGQVLGTAGDSGNASAVHDHYEHWLDGHPIDPLQHLREYQVLPAKRLALAYPGSIGPDIPLMQQRLKAHGFDPGPADGVWGDRTTLALKAFQTAHGLTPDAILGKNSWTHLLHQPAKEA